MQYSVSRVELESLAESAYRMGVSGYSDLAESAAARAVEELLAGRQTVGESAAGTENYLLTSATPPAWPAGIDSGLFVSSEATPSTIWVSPQGYSFSTTDNTTVRAEQFVRADSGFYGNTSERF